MVYEIIQDKLNRISNKSDSVVWHISIYDRDGAEYVYVAILIESEFMQFEFPVDEITFNYEEEYQQLEDAIKNADKVNLKDYKGRAKVVHHAICELIWNACDVDPELIAIRDEFDREV